MSFPDGIVDDLDLGYVLGSVTDAIDCGLITDSATIYNDLGFLYTILYTQSATPMVNDLVFRNIGRITSYVLSYNSSQNTITISGDHPIILNRDFHEYLEWDQSRQEYVTPVTITINKSPNNAIVVFTINGVNYTTNSVTVNRGTSVTYTVSSTGYISQTNTIIADVDVTYSVNLIKNNYTFTINPTPADSIVSLTAPGYTQEGNSITVPYETDVVYSVSHTGYNTSSGSITITDTSTVNINLIKNNYTLTINSIPNDAIVTLVAEGYTQEGNSITVPYETEVNWSVSKTGYTTKSGTQVVISTSTFTVSL